MRSANDAETSAQRSRSAERWRGILRWFVIPSFAVALIVFLLTFLESGRLPGIGSDEREVITLNGDFFSTSGEPVGAERGDGPGLGKPAPEFALVNTDGAVVELRDFRGKVVVINFWATWCTPCRKEFPELVKAYDEGLGEVVMIGINMQENREQVRQFADEFGAKFPILIDPRAEAADAYRVLGLPSSYFIDQHGVLREQHFGLLSREILEEKIEAARMGGLVGN